MPVPDPGRPARLNPGSPCHSTFPKVYATVFSGFYLALMLVLAALILRAVSIEFRSRSTGRAWGAGWDGGFFVGSLLPAVLFGVAIGNVMRACR